MIDGFGRSRATATILRGPAMGGDFNALDRAVCASRWNQIAVRALRGLGGWEYPGVPFPNVGSPFAVRITWALFAGSKPVKYLSRKRPTSISSLT